MEKRETNHLSGQFSKGGTGTKLSGTDTTLVMSTSTGTHCSILDSVHILTITCSFLI